MSQIQKRTAALLVVKAAWELLFSEVDEEDDEFVANKRRKIEKNEGFWEETIPRFDSQQFKAHFRLSPDTFEIFYRNICQLDSRCLELKSGNPPINIEKQIFITLWYLANTEYFRYVCMKIFSVFHN